MCEIKNEDNKKRRAALHNLGCKVNAYETEAMRERLEAAGYEIVDFTETADVYVVNTCTVTAIADKKSRQMLRRARRLNPDAVIVAAGCFAETIRNDIGGGVSLEDDISSLADIWIGNRAKDRLVGAIEEYVRARENVSSVASDQGPSGDRDNEVLKIYESINEKGGSYETLSLRHPTDHTRAFLKIQDGCDRFCSYCLIPYARGRSVSRPPDEVIGEAMALSADGFKEIVLTGIHISSYFCEAHTSRQGVGSPEGAAGIKADDGYRLIDLIEELQAIEGIQRIRLGSLEPVTVTPEFADRLSACDKVCPHFHLSLQSGCDRTLAAMRRRYTTSEFEAGVAELRRVYSDPAVTTDIIAGFPGETEEDFEESLTFAERLGFYEMHVFPYSRREGTAAAKMDGQLSNSVKNDRAARLIETAERMSEVYRKRHIGREVELLLEERLGDDAGECAGLWIGFTREYIKAAYTVTGEAESGSVVTGIFGRDIVPVL